MRECVCASLASDSSETVEIIIVSLGRLTASEMKMHDVLIIFLIFIQGHTDRNSENHKRLIMSEAFQPMPITFSVKMF